MSKCHSHACTIRYILRWDGFFFLSFSGGLNLNEFAPHMNDRPEDGNGRNYVSKAEELPPPHPPQCSLRNPSKLSRHEIIDLFGRVHCKKSCTLNSVKPDLNHKVSQFSTELAMKIFSRHERMKMQLLEDGCEKKISCTKRTNDPTKIVFRLRKLTPGP